MFAEQLDGLIITFNYINLNII